MNKYPELAEDELIDHFDHYKTLANDKTQAMPVRRQARIEAIHLYDEVLKTLMPYEVPKPTIDY